MEYDYELWGRKGRNGRKIVHIDLSARGGTAGRVAVSLGRC